MKMLFVGRDNPFNRRLIKEFSVEHEVVGCFFVETERQSWKGKRRMILQRIHKYGILKVLDQLVFHVFDRLFLRNPEPGFWKFRPEYCDTTIKLTCPQYRVDNINSKNWLKVCREMEPDIILATCSRVIFKPAFYAVPALGTYIIHEGITPEYKGLHTPLWALMKKEFQYIGYTLFKVNEVIDGGEILIQGTYNIKKREGYRTWSWIGHNAIISGLEDMKHALKKLEKNKSFTPLKPTNRKSGYYTWMGFSEFVRLYVKNYLAFARPHPFGVPEPDKKLADSKTQKISA